MKRKKINIPKKGAGRRLAEKLEKLGQQTYHLPSSKNEYLRDLVDKIIDNLKVLETKTSLLKLITNECKAALTRSNLM